MIISQSWAKRQVHKSDTTERHGAVAGAGRLGARRGKGTPKRFCQKGGGKGWQGAQEGGEERKEKWEVLCSGAAAAAAAFFVAGAAAGAARGERA